MLGQETQVDTGVPQSTRRKAAFPPAAQMLILSFIDRLRRPVIDNARNCSL
jgi:hypothetical protein